MQMSDWWLLSVARLLSIMKSKQRINVVCEQKSAFFSSEEETCGMF